jgi:hypothetical protein
VDTTGGAGRRGGGNGAVALVHHVARGGRGPGTGVAVAMDSDERTRGRGAFARMARCPLVATRAGGTFGTPVRVMRDLGLERLDRLFPHGARRMESADIGPLPDQIDRLRVTEMQVAGTKPTKGVPKASWCP